MYGVDHGIRGSDDDVDFLCPGDTSIDQVPLQHDVVGHQQGNHHKRIFADLGLMDSGSVRYSHFIKFVILILY